MPLRTDVVEIQAATAVGVGARRHHPGRGGGTQRVQQQIREQERSEMVHCKGPLHAIVGELSLAGDKPGVVDQHVDLRVTLAKLLGKPPHLVQRAEVGS
jgi:hypothetical protein